SLSPSLWRFLLLFKYRSSTTRSRSGSGFQNSNQVFSPSPPHLDLDLLSSLFSLLFQNFTYKSKNGLSYQEKLPALDLQQGFGGLLCCSQVWPLNRRLLAKRRRHTGEIVYLKTPAGRTHKGICSTGSQDNIPYSLALAIKFNDLPRPNNYLPLSSFTHDTSE
ncbi:hypothetical protein M8C21_016699, partial [Ambrosia artemisiifolia]